MQAVNPSASAKELTFDLPFLVQVVGASFALNKGLREIHHFLYTITYTIRIFPHRVMVQKLSLPAPSYGPLFILAKASLSAAIRTERSAPSPAKLAPSLRSLTHFPSSALQGLQESAPAPDSRAR